MYHKKTQIFLYCSVILTAVCLLLALNFGSVNVHLTAFFDGHQSQTNKVILLSIRLPEILNAFVVGGLLALAGMLMQILLQNPLADPYVLGVSGGAAVATLLGILAGLSLFWLHIFGYLGALLAIVLVFLLARSPKHWSPLKLLLTGVVLAAGWGAIISFILTISPNTAIEGLLFWLIGNIQSTAFSYLGLTILLLGFMISLLIAKPMDLLLQGKIRAKMLGVNVHFVYIIIYLLSALLTATAVSIAGTIGFVGLIVPHMIRMYIGSEHRFLIPCVILIGGNLMVLADLLARTLLAPERLPVGIFTVFIGVPIFLFLLLRQKT